MSTSMGHAHSFDHQLHAGNYLGKDQQGLKHFYVEADTGYQILSIMQNGYRTQTSNTFASKQEILEIMQAMGKTLSK